MRAVHGNHSIRIFFEGHEPVYSGMLSISFWKAWNSTDKLNYET